MIGTAFRKKVPAMRMSSSIKKINHSKIYHMIYRESKGVSKQEIMRRLGLSLPTVTQKLEELQAEGLVQDAGAADSTGGRRARAFSIVKDARLAVGLDINQDYYTADLQQKAALPVLSIRRLLPSDRPCRIGADRLCKRGSSKGPRRRHGGAGTDHKGP